MKGRYIKESSNLLQQDNNLVDYNNGERMKHQLGKTLFPGLETP
jgi:hypothetical protein